MKYIQFFFLLFFATGPLTAQNPWESLQRLSGTWKQFGKPMYEYWGTASADTIPGAGFSIREGEKKISEHLRIVRKPDGGIVYQAIVPNQNNGATIEFPLTFFTANSWTFENPEHDFPQTIDYWLQDDETLRATVSGSGQTLLLQFNKVPPEQTHIPANLSGYDLFVSNRYAGTIERFDAFTGLHKGSFGKEQIGGDTQALAFGPDGKLYVVSLTTRHVLKFDPATGAFLGNFTSGFDLLNPVNLAFRSDGFLYISQLGKGQDSGSVLRFDAATGKFDRDMTGPLAGPGGLAWDKSGNLYVACLQSRDIRKFPADPQTASSVVSPPGSLRGPSALWFMPGGDLLVADLDHVSIKRFQPAAESFVFQGPFADGFGRLEGVTLGPDGFLYACDARMNMVKKLEADSGESIGVYLDSSILQWPNGVAFWKR